jgi:hypothetical protein
VFQVNPDDRVHEVLAGRVGEPTLHRKKYHQNCKGCRYDKLEPLLRNLGNKFAHQNALDLEKTSASSAEIANLPGIQARLNIPEMARNGKRRPLKKNPAIAAKTFIGIRAK